jgi:hypothetical protein
VKSETAGNRRRKESERTLVGEESSTSGADSGLDTLLVDGKEETALAASSV